MGKNLIQPTVSIIMPAYNAELFIGEAIQSILNQSFTNFEFIIINDGSTDRTEEIINSFKDSRILYFKNEINLNIVESLNLGIKLARGEYIARMDADDICEPERLERQYRYLVENKLDIIGSWATNFSNKGDLGTEKLPSDLNDLKFFTLFFSPLLHPTTFGLASVFKHYQYRKEYEFVEDLDLWVRCLLDNKSIGNVSYTLIKYRLTDNQITRRKSSYQKFLSNEIRGRYFSAMYVDSDLDFGNFINRLGPNIGILELNSGLSHLIQLAKKNSVKDQWIKVIVLEILRRSIFNFAQMKNAFSYKSIIRSDLRLVIISFFSNNFKILYSRAIKNN
jgi:glycosyltransferase involved in cell wall biosynthesis